MAFGIWHFTNNWSPGSNFHHQRLELSAWNLETLDWNLESKTFLDSLTIERRMRITREIFFGTSIAGDISLKTSVLFS